MQPAPSDNSHRNRQRASISTLLGTAIAVAAVGVGALTWSIHSPAKSRKTLSLFKAPALSAVKAAPTGANKVASQPANVQEKPEQPGVAKLVNAKKQVPRVDLVIHYVADTRGNIEPCG